MKVANITLHAINNYGSVFQALATEYLFRQMGCEVETVDYIRENAQGDSLRKIITSKGDTPLIKLKRVVLCFLAKDTTGKDVLGDFRKRHLNLTSRKYRCDADLVCCPPEADIYCTGSDQTWNTVCQGEIPKPFFLDFVPEGKRKISFSASFGIPELPAKDKMEVKRLLSQYYAVSVRESSGVNILEDLGIKGTLVLDPTLAVGPDFWNEMAAPRVIDEDYILAYQLNRSTTFTKYVKRFSERTGLKVVQVRSHKDTKWKNGICLVAPKPEELLSLFKYSKYVITDSFHAIAFSLMFHCNFATIYPPRFSARLENILTLTNLHKRHVTDFEDFSCFNDPIGYDAVDGLFERERDRTLHFLKMAVE